MKHTITYTKRECAEIAKQYITRSEFRNKNWIAFMQAKENGWLDEIKPCKNKKLSYETCYNIAKQYNDYATFRCSEVAIYSKTVRNGWINDYTWLIKGNRDLNAKINCVYVYKFPEYNSIYIGRTMDKSRRYQQHLHDIKDSVYKFMKKYNLLEDDFEFKIIADKLTVDESSKLECEYIDYYKNNKWKLINRAKDGSIGSPIIKWTYEACLELAIKYEYLKDFADEYPNAYARANKMKWIKDYTWLKQFKPKEIYTYEECFEKAKKCKSYNQFVTEYPSYKSFAERNGWIKEWEWLKIKKHRDIVEYNLNGDFIEKHDGNLSAKFGSHLSSIIECAKGNRKYHNSRIWKYEDQVLDKHGQILKHIEINITPSYYRPVVQYDKNGNFVKEYSSIKKTGYCSSTIHDALNGVKTIYAKGYLWKYKDDVLNEDGTIIQHIEPRENKINKSLVLYDANGAFIKEYKTQTEAIKDGHKRHHIDYISNHKYTNLEELLKYHALWLKKNELVTKYGEVPMKIDPLDFI